MKLLYKTIPDKWREIGDGLEIPPGELNTIAEKNRDDPRKCLLHLFDVWLARINPLPTWGAMAEAVELVADPGLAAEVRQMEHS